MPYKPPGRERHTPWVRNQISNMSIDEMNRRLDRVEQRRKPVDSDKKPVSGNGNQPYTGICHIDDTQTREEY